MYITGYGYILPPNYIPKVLERLHETKLIPMEDVYFTGISSFSLACSMLHLACFAAKGIEG